MNKYVSLAYFKKKMIVLIISEIGKYTQKTFSKGEKKRRNVQKKIKD